MIAHKNPFGKFGSREAAVNGGKRSQQVQSQKRMDKPLGPRATPPGKLLRTFMNADHLTGETIRYDIYKSYHGKRKIDIHIDRSRIIKGKSVTWLMNKIRAKRCILPEIVED